MRTTSTLLTATLLLALGSQVHAANHLVHVGGSGLVFTPSSIEVLVNDTVTFHNDGGFHNVVSDAGAPMTFRCANGCDGAGGDGTPLGSGWDATITITSAAAHSSIGYHCEVHGQVMSGTISVTNPVDLQSFEID